MEDNIVLHLRQLRVAIGWRRGGGS